MRYWQGLFNHRTFKNVKTVGILMRWLSFLCVIRVSYQLSLQQLFLVQQILMLNMTSKMTGVTVPKTIHMRNLLAPISCLLAETKTELKREWILDLSLSVCRQMFMTMLLCHRNDMGLYWVDVCLCPLVAKKQSRQHYKCHQCTQKLQFGCTIMVNQMIVS